ncbi:MAG: chloride channel protein [Gemmatimonadota bacterium]|nr:chloride channel protein [Gemmatimonadota bacterium]
MGRAPRTHLADFTVNRRVVPITLIACGIGALCAFVALALLRMIALFTNLFYYGRFSVAAATPATHHLGAWAVVIPAVGGLAVGIMARFGTDRIRGHGIPEAIEAILTRGSRVDLRVAILKPISAAVSIGSGGPFGAEGPIIMTGGAFGSLVAQRFNLTAAERKTLLVAGAAAGMSATFAAPVAAALLAVELLLFEWKPRSFIPVAAASAVAAALRPAVLGAGPLFPTPPLAAPPGGLTLAVCLPVGLAAGALAALMTYAVYAAEDAFPMLPIPWMWWPAVGGLVIGLGGLVSPHALGVGYDVIADLLAGSLVMKVAVALLVVKTLIWSISLGSGTSGGVLAPLLIVGASLGSLLAPMLPPEGAAFWPLVGMASILGAAMGVPLTAVVFALELTHDVDMLLPLLIAVVAANAFTSLTLRRSILTEKVDRKGFHLSREYATDPLELLFVADVMTPDAGAVVTAPEAVIVHPDEPLTHAVNRMAERGCTTLAVVPRDEPGRVVGRVTLEQLLVARSRHLEEERQRDGTVPLTAFMPPWLRDST